MELLLLSREMQRNFQDWRFHTQSVQLGVGRFQLRMQSVRLRRENLRCDLPRLRDRRIGPNPVGRFRGHSFRLWLRILQQRKFLEVR